MRHRRGPLARTFLTEGRTGTGKSHLPQEEDDEFGEGASPPGAPSAAQAAGEQGWVRLQGGAAAGPDVAVETKKPGARGAEESVGATPLPATDLGEKKPESLGECEVCGNIYARSFQIVMHGETHVFDSFECAIHQLAPVCGHCHCRIVGHGIESDSSFYCCAHCARHAGVHGAVDNV